VLASPSIDIQRLEAVRMKYHLEMDLSSIPRLTRGARP
jgi:hypothetical protein